jgi:hypothetical protein
MGDSWVDVLGAYGDRLALNTYLGCTGADSSVVWFNPETKVVTPALGPPANRGYVEGAILFGQTAYGL